MPPVQLKVDLHRANITANSFKCNKDIALDINDGSEKETPWYVGSHMGSS